jgi:hypothetical protein
MCKVPRAFYIAHCEVKVQYYAAPSVSAISPVTYKWGGAVRQTFELDFLLWTTDTSETLSVTLVQEIEIYWLVSVDFSDYQ